MRHYYHDCMTSTIEATAPVSKKVSPKSKFSRVWNFFTTVMLFTSAVAGLVWIVPTAMGATSMTVLTGSMAPAIPPGHIIVVDEFDVDTIKVGDVVVYQPENNVTNGVPIVHRVKSIASNDTGIISITMKGDANPNADLPIKPSQIIGKNVFTIPYLGLPKVAVFNFFNPEMAHPPAHYSTK